MKNIKRLFALAISLFMLLAVVSCGSSSKVNTKVPYGTLSDSDSYASVSGASISKKMLYDLMRKDGYSYLSKDIKYNVFADVIALADYNNDADDRETINTSIISEIYGVSDTEAYENLSASDIETLIQKYIDNKYKEGISLSADELKIKVVRNTEHDEDEFVVDNATNKFPESLVNNDKLFNCGITKYGKSELKKIYMNEYNEDGTKNDYYISEEDIQSYYYSTAKYYGTSKGIVIKFISKAQAERVMNSVLGSTTIPTYATEQEEIDAYISLYNAQYRYRDQLTAANYLDNEYVVMTNDEDLNELNTYSDKFATFFRDTLEDGEGLKNLFNIDGSYYLVYRISCPEVIEWDDLKANDVDEFNEVHDDILDILQDAKNTATYQGDLINERYEKIIAEDAISIYDPIYSVQYYNEFKDQDYELESEFDNSLVYKVSYSGNTYQMTVEEFYAQLEKIYGLSKSLDHLIRSFALNTTFVDQITDEELDATTDEYKAAVKEFNNGKTNYSKKIGLANYLTLKYGYSNKSDVMTYYYKAASAMGLLNEYNGSHTTDDVNFNADDALFTRFETICKEIYDNQMSIDVSHMLIFIDDEGSGNTTDLDKYRAKLNPTLQTEFDAAVLSLSQAIIAEAKLLSTTRTYSEALQYIAEDAFVNGEKIGYTYADLNDTWNDYKTFNFSLKFEDLSNITYSSVSSYVDEFKNEIISLYDEFKDDKDEFDEDGIYEKGVLQFTGSTPLTSLDQICKTTFGYHLINVYDVDTTSSCLFTKDNDYDKDGTYKEYEHLKIILKADTTLDEDEDPDRILYANGYSANEYPSASQLFVYYYEYSNVGSCSSLKSTHVSLISSLFTDVITRYKSGEFINYRDIKQIGAITFADATNDAKFAEYMKIIERTIDSYNTKSDYKFKNWFTYDWTVDLTGKLK